VAQALSETDKAYLSGIVDGEGSVGIYRQHVGRSGGAGMAVRLSIVSTTKALIDWLELKIGFGSVTTRPESVEKNRNRAYLWQAHGQNAVDLLINLTPYLVIKKRQARVAILFQKTRGITGKKVSTLISFQRERLRKIMRHENRRGYGTVSHV